MTAGRAITVILSLVLCACSGGPAPKPPYAGIKLGKPYEVYGRWYKPNYNSDYDEIGVASWYGPGFHGGHTANGDRFDQNALTAAHRTLPMPSIVRVTNLDNGLSAIIEVNDRGPFAHDRIIDLSKASAVKLGVIRTGTAKVRVQFLERETKEYVQNMTAGTGTKYAMGELKSVNPDEAGAHEEALGQPGLQVETRMFGQDFHAPAAGPPLQQPETALTAPQNGVSGESPVPGGGPSEFSVVDNQEVEIAPVLPPQVSPPPTPQTLKLSKAVGYFVQAGTFGQNVNAISLSNRISSWGEPEVMEVTINGKKMYRVIVGPYEIHDDAKNMLSKLASIGIPDAKIVHN